MRRIYFAILIAGILIFLTAPAKAQVSVGIGINISSQPIWGPVGYDNVQYYYLPDIDAYYYVPQHLFFFFSGGNWISSPNLPPQYSNYDLYSGYKVVINENRPYLHDQDYRVKYSSYKNRHDQHAIRDSHDSKYSVAQQQGHSKSPVNKQVQSSRKAQGNKQVQSSRKAPSSKQAQGKAQDKRK